MDETHAALVGLTIAGKFYVEAFIGRGAMGAVCRARQIALDKSVAIKVLRPERAGDAMSAALFQREARAASRLTNLVRGRTSASPRSSHEAVDPFGDGARVHRLLVDVERAGRLSLEHLLAHAQAGAHGEEDPVG